MNEPFAFEALRTRQAYGVGGVRAMVCTMRAVRVTFVILPKNRDIAAKLVKVMAPAVPCPNFAWKAS